MGILDAMWKQALDDVARQDDDTLSQSLRDLQDLPEPSYGSGVKTIDFEAATKAVRDLLTALGENPDREGLLDTPKRVAKAYQELLAGYDQDPRKVLGTTFEGEGYDQMVALREVPFYSLCEHHMLPFTGTATVVYIPRARVVGLSKLARLVECYGRRLQIQERMTNQIGSALQEVLDPIGYGVAIKAAHLCMCARGVGKNGAEMVTHAVGGLIKEDEKARHEFLRLAGI